MPRLKKSKTVPKPITRLGDVDPMTLSQCAQVLHCHPHTVRRHVKEGDLICTYVGNRMLIFVEQVKIFLERQTQKARARAS